MPNKDFEIWPLYFAKKALDAKRVKFKEGQPFPLQDKFTIRGYARAYGVENGDAVPFGELPYVQVLNVGAEDVAKHILDRNLSFRDAKKLVSNG
jgi:hypothetical protein